MIKIEKAKVMEVLEDGKDYQLLKLETNDNVTKAYNFLLFNNPAKPGEEVLINTTASTLELGTGGHHFVLSVINNAIIDGIKGKGHIMKLNYTPVQSAFLCVEEEDSPYHQYFLKKLDLQNKQIVAGSLHSQLASFTAVAKYLNPDIKIVYIMTDTAALPITLSNLVRELKEKKLLDATITCGNAFGGDYESVNIFSAIQMAEEALQADITIIICGPGLVGTASTYGFGAMELSSIVNAVHFLNGRPVVIPRLSMKDQRDRHKYISHHTLTSMEAAMIEADIIFPDMDDDLWQKIYGKINKSKILEKHKIIKIEDDVTKVALNKFDIKVSTMGKSFEEEPYFFQAAGVTAKYVIQGIQG